MSYKRSRSTFEADVHAPYALFGTPLPDENDARDDGSYLPLWKQDMRDEKGRRRLHGAFTGGWSAGYFNTVGSKEGWTPSTFVSSRAAKRQDGTAPATIQQRAEQYMDEEDLADAAEAQTLQVAGAFAGLGASATQDEMRAGGILGLFRPAGDTRGRQLLRKMGWKDGQGIGPKIWRNARLDSGKSATESDATAHMFAPDDSQVVQFTRKPDRKGLGHQGETRLQGLGRSMDSDRDDSDNDDYSMRDEKKGLSLFEADKKKTTKIGTGAFGVGVLNDTGSDEEDPYEMGPKIRYHRVMGGNNGKKKKKKNNNEKKTKAAINPSLQKAPVFLPKTARSGNGFSRCHDGRLPLDGFVLAKVIEDLAALLTRYEPPEVPDGWKSSRDPAAKDAPSTYTSTADAANASTLDPRSRAALLGEKPLPGKSVFDFISAAARDKLAAASGNQGLPPGLGQVAEGHAPISAEERRRALWNQVPKLDQQTAAAALSRSSSGPYADNEPKRERYRKYLLSQANPGLPIPDKEPSATDEDYIREASEFYNCGRIFKPMTGFMASRFTASKTVLDPSTGTTTTTDGNRTAEMLSTPGGKKAADPADEAAKMGMFGTMTRSVADFYPTRLLCKRFNVRPPVHAQPDCGTEIHAASTSSSAAADRGGPPWTAAAAEVPSAGSAEQAPMAGAVAPARQPAVVVDPEKNEAVEGKAANAQVLRAIFGDSDSE
ncbi:hypothetical protein E4U42_007890 [Claviceps africana]|uniref:G-patch domain-containing protein n=1 Tax=Claviceps africana TaxID=83212 RepID=A0A8K0NEF4_9HYPO|nr:hypothetical protein E4U42_007890 [Claviceps africana]